MPDPFQFHALGFDSPGRAGAAVTPSDSTDLPDTARFLWIGGAGSGGLKITTPGGDELTFAGVPVGVFPVSARRVWATGTNVTNIIALW